MNEKISICRRGCCPTIERVDGNVFVIKDDYGGSVVLTHEQIDVLHASKEVL